MLRRTIVGAALLVSPLLLTLSGPSAGQGFQARIPTIDELPEGPGRDKVFYACTACHGLDIIKAQRLSADRWDEVISVMIDAQGLLPPTPEERKVLVDYLAAAFPESTSPAGGYVNPFLPR